MKIALTVLNAIGAAVWIFIGADVARQVWPHSPIEAIAVAIAIGAAVSRIVALTWKDWRK